MLSVLSQYIVDIKSTESELHPHITYNSTIKVYPIPPTPNFLKTKNKRLFLIYGPLKVLFQIWSLWLILGYKTRPAKWMLVQVSETVLLHTFYHGFRQVAYRKKITLVLDSPVPFGLILFLSVSFDRAS